MSNTKKYGLIIPNKATTSSKLQQPVFQATRNIFGSDLDSEDESIKQPVLLQPSHNINRQAKATREKAILQDPTVYEYDEIYDSMKTKKEEKIEKSRAERKPRYIENLMKTAKKRKIENERRMERQIHKEREEEGDQFADKDVFVTSAYKKKLEEMKLEEEKEQREEYLENICDVKKQKDLGGFYRHLYKQKLGFDENDSNQEEKQDVNTIKATEILNIADNEKTLFTKSRTTTKRNYRSKKSLLDNNIPLSEGEIEDSDEELHHVNLEDIRMAKNKAKEQNLDADSDFSVNDPTDDDDDDNDKTDTNPVKVISKQDAFKKPSDSDDLEKASEKNNMLSPLKDETNIGTKESKPKIDIWKKRTVDEVFNDALRRYYERKTSRRITVS